jgi:phage baseplate assembly protein gpV
MTMTQAGAAQSSNRPNDPAQPRVKVDGTEVTGDGGSLLGMEIETAIGRPNLCTLTYALALATDGTEEPDLPTWCAVAKAVEVDTKDGDAWVPLFDGEITAIDYEMFGGQTTLTVTAYDKRHKLYREDKSRTLLDQSYGDAINTLVGESSLSATISGLPTTVHKYLVQHHRSNGEWIEDILQSVGAVMVWDDKKLKIDKLDALSTSPVLELDFSVDVDRYRFRGTTDAHVGDVEVRGWDVAQKKEIVGKAASSDRPSSDVNIDAKLKAAFTDAKVFTTQAVPAQSDAEAIAKGILRQQVDAAVQLEASGPLHPKLRAGLTVKVKKVAKSFEGTYRLTTVRHTLDEGHLLTEFSCRGAADESLPGVMQQAVLGKHATGHGSDPQLGVMPAIVTDVDDPEDLGRVMVKFPWLAQNSGNDISSFWVRVAMMGAGDDRGWMVMPEVQDEVLVAFEQGDLQHPIVIGALWNGKDKPPRAKAKYLKDGKIIERVFRSRLGHEVIIDDSDDKSSITIVSATKNLTITLDDKNKKLIIDSKEELEIHSAKAMNIKCDDAITVEAAKDLTLKGDNVTVEAKSKSTVKGSDIDVAGSSSANVKAGSAKLELGSSGLTADGGSMTTIKGGMVKIN